ncbi:hypothetical protein PG987_010523 [Apiospora arundinis]
MASTTTATSGENEVQTKTVWVKWDVKGGSDRTHEPPMDTTRDLEGSPNIQGVEIKSAIDVNLKLWHSSNASGAPNKVIQGPTNGKTKINPERFGAYRFEAR